MSMYKTLCIAVLLLATFAFTSGSRPADAAQTTLPSAVIVAKVALTNQTTTIPQTVIFTPLQSGLYRVSPYMALMTSPVTCCWNFDFFWTDEGGTRTASTMMTLGNNSCCGYGLDSISTDVPGSFTFRAVAGQPVSYDISGGGADAGPYELYLVIERLP
jgi:hypothetical protein